MSDDVFLCFNCGKRNRVSAGSSRASARCGSCAESLFPADDIATKPAPASYAPRSQSRTSSVKADGSGTGYFKRLFWFGIVCVGIFAYFDSTQKPRLAPRNIAPTNTVASDNSTPAPTIVPAKPLPPAVSQMPGLMWNNTGRPTEAPFEIRTSFGADYYLKLVDDTNGADAIGIFVKGGQTLNIEVPLGSYRLRYASGQTWRGENALFGPGDMTSYSETGDRFDFQVEGDTINGYTVELIMQTNGNLATHGIDASQF